MDEVNLGMLILRVIGGLTLAAHGYNKIFRGGRLAGTGRWFDSMGMRPGQLHARLAAFTEVSAGVGLALGLLTPLCGAGVVGVMFVAGYTVHRKAFFVLSNGFEFVLILATIAVAVSTVGPGEWSLDNAIGFDVNGVPGLLISAVGGVAAAVGLLAVCFRPPVPAAEAA